MTTNRHPYLHLLFNLVFAVICTASFAETIEQQFEVNLGGKLRIETALGAIKINTHPQATIELRVLIDNDEENQFSYSHELNDGNLTLIGELNGKYRWARGPKVEFHLTIPKQYNVDLNTSGGSLTIQELTGDLQAHTSGGSISIGNITGDVFLRTSGGSIRSETISGNLNAHTSGGSINVTLDKQITENAKLTTSGGSITAYLIPNIKLDIYASTSGGRVKSDFLIDGKVKKMSVRGLINGGGPKLTLKTSGGSIKIKQI